MILETNKTVREIAISHPAAVRVFETLGIDYCCGGQRSLDEACRGANVPLDEARRLLEQAGEQPVAREDVWTAASIRELTGHIVEQHHVYVRREAARLTPMLTKVVAKHGEAHPELGLIQGLFEAMADELFAHMMKEENVLFPYLVRMESGCAMETRRRPRCSAPSKSPSAACSPSTMTPVNC